MDKILKKSKISFLFCLLLSFYISKSLQATQSENPIVKGLQEKNLITKPDGVAIIYPGSHYADQIIFITTKNENGECKIAAKVFKEINNYKKEKKQMSDQILFNYVEAVNQFNRNCGLELPIMVGYKGGKKINGKGVILLEKAEGVPLKKFYDLLGRIDASLMEDVFKNIGTQMGNLDRLFYENTGKRLYSGDLHEENLFYNTAKKQVYWIDWSDATLVDFKPNPLKENKFAYKIVSLAVPLATFEFLTPTKKDIEDMLQVMKKRCLASKSLFQAYANQMKQTGIDVIEAYNKDFMSMNEKDVKAFNAEVEKEGFPELTFNLDDCKIH